MSDGHENNQHPGWGILKQIVDHFTRKRSTSWYLLRILYVFTALFVGLNSISFGENGKVIIFFGELGDFSILCIFVLCALIACFIFLSSDADKNHIEKNDQVQEKIIQALPLEDRLDIAKEKGLSKDLLNELLKDVPDDPEDDDPQDAPSQDERTRKS